MTHSFLLAFVAFFAAVDIIGVLPMYLSMTQGMGKEERRRTANTSMLVAYIVAVVFTFIGKPAFQLLGIQLPDFRIAGGLVLLLVALADLLGNPENTNRGTGSSGVVPIAVPLITGPAILTTLILQVATAGYAIVLVALTLNYLIAWVALRKSVLITQLIGKDGTVVISKLAALLLTSIAVAMMRVGVQEVIASFGK